MNVVIQVNGRDAIPVRAIPFITNWQLFTPGVLAKVLAQDDEVTAAHGMRELTAYRVEGGNVAPIPAIWWRNFACRELKLLSDTISASQSSHDAGYQQWRWQSVAKLPAGVFVWRDEFVQGYERQLVRLMRAAWRDPDVEYPDHGAKVETPEEMQQRLKLDFEPFITDKAILATIVEGFETGGMESQSTTTPAAPIKPVSRSTAQDDAILRTIKELGFDPLALPTVAKGKAGVKSEVRVALVGVDPLFPKEGKQLDKAWERLSQFGDIAYKK